MKIVAAMMIHNGVENDRMGMALACAESLDSEADELLVVDNGSTDGTTDWVRQIGGLCYEPTDGVRTCGRGMNIAITAAANRGDVVVFSNEDMFWRPGWRAVIEEFWTYAPDDVAILCGDQEPNFPWSQPVGVIEAGGVRALQRPTVPGRAWTLLSEKWKSGVGPVPELHGWDDVPTCYRLGDFGYRLAAVDCCDHVGEDTSTWGNNSLSQARPFDFRSLNLATVPRVSMGGSHATLSAEEAS